MTEKGRELSEKEKGHALGMTSAFLEQDMI
jgi:hypothetical protein